MRKKLVSLLLLLVLLVGGCCGGKIVFTDRDKPRSLPFPHAGI